MTMEMQFVPGRKAVAVISILEAEKLANGSEVKSNRWTAAWRGGKHVAWRHVLHKPDEILVKVQIKDEEDPRLLG